jgi:hypothetical protein
VLLGGLISLNIANANADHYLRNQVTSSEKKQIQSYQRRMGDEHGVGVARIRDERRSVAFRVGYCRPIAWVPERITSPWIDVRGDAREAGRSPRSGR